MDVQQALLSKIVRDAAMVQAVNGRITTEFFTDDRYKRVYQFLLDHWQKYGTPADLAVVQASFPTYEWPEFRQSIDYFMDALRERRKRAILTECMGVASDSCRRPTTPTPWTRSMTPSARRSCRSVLRQHRHSTPT